MDAVIKFFTRNYPECGTFVSVINLDDCLIIAGTLGQVTIYPDTIYVTMYV